MSGDYIKSFCTSPPTLRFLFIKLKVIKIQVKEKEREKKNMKGIKPSWTERSCSKKKAGQKDETVLCQYLSSVLQVL